MKKEYLNEIWRPIKGYEGLYEVSNLGRVKSLVRNGTILKERILNQFIVKNYLKTNLRNKGQKQYYVHRLVAEAFLPIPNELKQYIGTRYLQVNHKDENPLNNIVSNLEWCTASYNTNYGTRNERVALKESKIVLQYDLEGNFIKEWYGVKETAKYFKCYDNRFNIAIKEKRSAFNSFWSNIKVPKLDITEYRLSQHSEIYEYDLEGNFIKMYKSIKEIQQNFKLTKATICSAKSQKLPVNGFYFVDAFVNINDLVKSRELIDNITDRSVSKYKNGIKLYTYPSLAKAAKENNTTTTVIKKSIKNDEGIWSYGISDTYNNNINPVPVKVFQYDLEDNLVKVWDSISSCSREHPKVRAVLKGIRNQTHNFKFKLS